MLLDGETFDLVQHIETVLAAVAGHELEPRINAELMQSVLEIATPVCRTAADAEQELRALRSYVAGIARERGNAAKTMCRDERSPVGSPRQNGELAERASSEERCGSRPLTI